MTEQSILIEEFRKYLERFNNEVGDKEFGQYGTWKQFVIKKMNYDEFVVKYEDYQNLKKIYAEILERGDTVNDAIFRTLREAGANIILEVK